MSPESFREIVEHQVRAKSPNAAAVTMPTSLFVDLLLDAEWSAPGTVEEMLSNPNVRFS